MFIPAMLPPPKNGRKILAILLCAVVLASAQAFGQKPANENRLPRVGTVKRLRATVREFPEGWGNHFLKATKDSPADAYIFVGSRDDSPAWMNLDGRDVRLEFVKKIEWYRHFHPFVRLEYRVGDLRVTVNFDNPQNYFDKYAARIVLRKGSAALTISAVGFAECRSESYR